MTTTANELSEREEKGKKDEGAERKTDWTWFFYFLFFISDLFLIYI
jgi:hypothetical protein